MPALPEAMKIYETHFVKALTPTERRRLFATPVRSKAVANVA